MICTPHETCAYKESRQTHCLVPTSAASGSGSLDSSSREGLYEYTNASRTSTVCPSDGELSDDQFRHGERQPLTSWIGAPATSGFSGTTTPAAPALEVVAAGLADAVEEPDEADDLDDDPDPEGLTWVVTGGTEEVREPVVLALLALVVREDEDEDP
ncbi:hypothetical protein MBLNU459_g2583t1 [Dothideomycetes sp. NU459]